MVQNPRKKTGTDRIRPLNRPVPVDVRETADGAPGSLSTGRRSLEVTEVRDVWDLQEEWWRSSLIARRYYDVTLEDGSSTVIFRDQSDGAWYTQKA